ncbi:hypothetical protein SAMN05216215_103732 [Saccharopolyspora shandongensis]|uniref:Uncharacterized protein n=1 Tax=Saccharopolyspora shandongensis TaxID=418495 RepID=A0A1H3NAI2_9PSEU|nr:hypothetical protein SAMN05216215_103732 [Saccharopolyspora shandongensis]
MGKSKLRRWDLAGLVAVAPSPALSAALRPCEWLAVIRSASGTRRWPVEKEDRLLTVDEYLQARGIKGQQLRSMRTSFGTRPPAACSWGSPAW